MRILLSLTYYLPHVSGITLYNHRLARALVRAGHRVTILTSQYDSTLPREDLSDGVRIVRVPVWFWISKGAIMPGFPLRFWRLLRTHDAVVMNLPNTPVEAILGPVLARLAGRPLVAKHMCDIELPPSFFNRIVNAVTYLTNLFAVALSDRAVSMTRDYAAHSPVLRHFPRRLAVIPPPVEMEPATAGQVADWKRQRGIAEGPLIGFAARLSTEKGVEVLLRALPRVLKDFPTATVLFAGEKEGVIGESAYRERLEPMLLHTAGNWRFLGLVSQEELPSFYTACDVTLLPSLNRTESFGIVQVESMMCGTPVVASNLPGVRDSIRRTGMGRIVPIGDEAALAEAIVDVMRHRRNYLRPPEVIRRRYSTARTRRMYERLLGDCVDARGTAWTHLKAKPMFLALQRAVEHREIRKAGPLEHPLVDVGIGDGHFGAAVLGTGIDLGVDLDPACVAEAGRRRVGGRLVYRRTICASATRLPLGTGSFATVVSNSTLEHIPDLDAALGELFRILRPGGRLIATVPTDRWNENLFTGRLLRRLGLASLATRYESWFRRVQRHHHLLSAREWAARLEAAGFRVVVSRGYFPPAATATLELLHYEGWHNLLSRALTGRWVLLPWRALYALPEAMIVRFLRAEPTAQDCCVYLEARKPEA